MAKRRVKRPSAVIGVVPAHGVVIAIVAAGIGFFVDGDEYVQVRGYPFKVVPLIQSLPFSR